MQSVYHGPCGSTPVQSMMRAALAHAKKGYRVFPCKPAPNKSPHTQRGFYDATIEQSRVHAFWNAHPGASIGVPTGEKFWVLDVDNLSALEELPGKLPNTWTVRTPRGGFHFYFRAVEGITNRSGGLPKGIDVRGTGGYVLVPPSSGYTVENKAPMAVAPEWLLEQLRKQKQRPTKAAETQSPTPISAAGEKIPEGTRNITLTSIAGHLHDGIRTADQLTADLLEINAARCMLPLPDQEVEKIATSVHRRAPAKPSKEVGPEVLEKLDEIEDAHLWSREWSGNRWKSPRSVLVALIKEARKHGEQTAAGIRVSISVRNLALTAAGSLSTIQKAVDRLKEAEIIARDTTGRTGTNSGAFVLLSPRARSVHSPTFARRRASVPTLRAPLTAPRLRWSKPIWETVDGQRRYVDTIRRLGKPAEALLDVLERAGGALELEDLAAKLGINRPRDMRRRVVARLEAAAVVECSETTVRLCRDWLVALERRREDDEEIADCERDRKRYAEQSRRYGNRLEVQKLHCVGMGREEISGALGLGLENVRSILGGLDQAPTAREMDEWQRQREALAVESDGVIEDLERVEDSDPALPELTSEELRALVAIIAFEDHFGPGSFKWNQAGCKELFYAGPIGGYWPTPDELERIRAHVAATEVVAA